MEPEDQTWLEAELTKINFVLEALWANALITHGARPADVDALAADLRRQFLTLPATLSSGGPAPANDCAATDIAVERLSQFFVGVRRRVATVQGD